MRQFVSSVALAVVLMAVSFDTREKGAAVAGEPDGSRKVARQEPSLKRHGTVPEESLPAGGKVITNSTGMELVLIEPGEFMMGSPDSDTYAHDPEKPQHRVRITKPFYLGKYPVTQGQYEQVMGKNPSWFSKSGRGKNTMGKRDTSQFPVEYVSWENAAEFCKRLSEKEKRDYRLPTEAQWEYACRAGSKTRWCFGEDEKGLADYAWFDGNSGHQTHPVGQKEPNPWGLYDMQGNVWQWCRDWFGKNSYASSPAEDPAGPETGSHRVLRGGCWYGPGRHCRSAERFDFAPDIRGNCQGLRVALVAADK